MQRINAKFKSYRGWILPPDMRDFHKGRIWLKEHTPFAAQDIECAINRRYFRMVEGIQTSAKLVCNRCHNENQQQFIHFDCSKCLKKCVYCRLCLNMGRVSSCTQLLTWCGPKPRLRKNHRLEWQGTFTPAQRRATDEMLASLKVRRNHLCNAVCGAGKTEILFPVVHFALEMGYRVCIATPRTDVVLELFPRFQEVFPTTTIHALYGGAPKQRGYAQLVMATTHQLYRFEQAFDVVIVDEADAFPYTYDATLQNAVLKAKKTPAPILFVTATPSQKLLQQNEGYSFIPKRYHNYSLPVPRFSALWGYDRQINKEVIPAKLQQWTKIRLAQNEPFLIFFPTIALMEKARPLFQKLHSQIQTVHSEDPERKEKVLQLRNEEIPGLLTTTILERGITIKNVQVAVVGAESRIFSASALIQIAGRVGRNKDYADGDVVFFHHGITIEMDEAKRIIENSNKEGFPV
ncbi:MAG: DEAD/DEAH box helicase family protein [Lysinibacillus sp.]